MPSWWVHRNFAFEMGLDLELSRIVDEIIDFAHILPSEYATPKGVFEFPKDIEKKQIGLNMILSKLEKFLRSALEQKESKLCCSI